MECLQLRLRRKNNDLETTYDNARLHRRDRTALPDRRDPWAAPTRRGQPTASHRSLFVELLGTCNLCFDCFASEVGSFGSRSLRFSERGTRLVGPDS